MKIKSGFEIAEDTPGIYVARATGERAKEFPGGIQMGMSGAFLWDYMSQKDCDRAELILCLDSFYECETSTEQITADVDMFVSFLRANNLLEE